MLYNFLINFFLFLCLCNQLNAGLSSTWSSFANYDTYYETRGITCNPVSTNNILLFVTKPLFTTTTNFLPFYKGSTSLGNAQDSMSNFSFVAWNNAGTHIARGYENGYFNILTCNESFGTGGGNRTLGTGQQISSISWNESGSTLALASQSTIKWYSTQTSILNPYNSATASESSNIPSIAFMDSTNLIVAVANKIKVYVGTDPILSGGSLNTKISSNIKCIAYNKIKSLLAVCSENGEIYIAKFITGTGFDWQQSTKLDIASYGSPVNISWNTDGNYLALTTSTGYAQIYKINISEGAAILTADGTPVLVAKGNTYCAWFKNGSLVVGGNGIAKIYTYTYTGPTPTSTDYVQAAKEYTQASFASVLALSTTPSDIKNIINNPVYNVSRDLVVYPSETNSLFTKMQTFFNADNTLKSTITDQDITILKAILKDPNSTDINPNLKVFLSPAEQDTATKWLANLNARSIEAANKASFKTALDATANPPAGSTIYGALNALIDNTNYNSVNYLVDYPTPTTGVFSKIKILFNPDNTPKNTASADLAALGQLLNNANLNKFLNATDLVTVTNTLRVAVVNAQLKTGLNSALNSAIGTDYSRDKLGTSSDTWPEKKTMFAIVNNTTFDDVSYQGDNGGNMVYDKLKGFYNNRTTIGLAKLSDGFSGLFDVVAVEGSKVFLNGTQKQGIAALGKIVRTEFDLTSAVGILKTAPDKLVAIKTFLTPSAFTDYATKSRDLRKQKDDLLKQ